MAIGRPTTPLQRQLKKIWICIDEILAGGGGGGGVGPTGPPGPKGDTGAAGPEPDQCPAFLEGRVYFPLHDGRHSFAPVGKRGRIIGGATQRRRNAHR